MTIGEKRFLKLMKDNGNCLETHRDDKNLASNDLRIQYKMYPQDVRVPWNTFADFLKTQRQNTAADHRY